MTKKELLFFSVVRSLFAGRGKVKVFTHLILLSIFLAILVPNIFASPKILDPKIFPRSDVINVQVYFWKKIFSEVSISEVLIHDRELVLPIFEKVSVIGLTRRQAQRKIKRRKYHVQKQLKTLATKLEKKRSLNADQKKLLNKFYRGITPKELRRAAARLRTQYGLKERFRDGLIRSGAYMSYIRKMLKRYGVPLELAYLPHVESSFNYVSHSKSGAKGIWQFTRSTGRLYMRVNSRVDERIDPFISTEAAAKLLKANYKFLRSWPLAITAYNHGPNGVNKIAKRLKTRDLGKMIQHYRSRRFSFASKNFYAEFLAAAEVAANYQKYFGPLKFAPPLQYGEVRLPRSMSLNKIVSRLPYSRDQILALNPALRPAVVRSGRHVPTYYRIKIPLSPMNSQQISQSQNALGNFRKVSSRDEAPASSSRWVTVKKGDSLSAIAKRYRMSTEKLVALNDISLKSVIYPGQVLKISSSQPSYVVVRRGDSLSIIARRHGVSLKQLAAINRLKLRSIIHPGQRLKLPDVNNRFSSSRKRIQRVIVKRGDTLSGIARRVGVNVDQLISINGLSKGSVIYPGQRLRLSL